MALTITINGQSFTAYRTRRPRSLPEYYTGRGPLMRAQWIKLNGGHWPVFWNEPKGTGYYFEWRKAWYRLPFLHGNEVVKLGYLQEVTLTEN
jgi:hypothetical protein